MINKYRQRSRTPGLLLHSLLLLAILIANAGSVPVDARAAVTSSQASVAARPAPFGGGTELGIVTNAVSRQHAAPNAPIYADLLAGTGARWVREEFRWDLVEPQRGHYRWGSHDNAVAAYRSQGFKIIGLLAYSAGWAVHDQVPSSGSPPPRDEWANYVTQTVSRYRDGVTVWEIWNEPDHANYWHGDARLFAGLLTETAALIRQVDPDAIIISGGVSDIPGGLAFLEQVGVAGGFDALDGIGVHPYLGYHSLLYGVYRDRDLGQLRAFQQRFNRPIWITEFGFSSLIEGGGATGEEAQANGMVRQIIETAAAGLDVRAMVVYDAADDGQHGLDYSHFLGLFRHDGHTPKPAFGALQTIGRTLAGLSQVEFLPVEDPLVTRYRFHHGNGIVTDVFWTDGEQRQVALHPVGAIQVTDLYGARTETPSTLGQTHLAIGTNPVYLTYQPAPEGLRFIAESGHTLSGAFLHEWLATGALEGLGLPLSEPMEIGNNTWIQFFERGRLEFDGAMRWGLTGVEIAGRYPAAARAPLRCVQTPDQPRAVSPGETYDPAPPCPVNSQTVRYFPETGHSLANGMLAFWEQRGGLGRFGYPISEEFEHEGIRIQLFERARLEYRPGGDTITIGRAGAEVMETRQADWHLWPTSPVGTDPARVYVAQTRHSLTPRAAQAWTEFGGIHLLGFPLSEEYMLDGAIVQLFERGRIVWSPEGTPSLALVGYEHARRQTNLVVHKALAPYFCHTGNVPVDASFGRTHGDTRPRCQPDARYLPETQHSLRGNFGAFWEANGGVTQFGYPITEEFVLDGRIVQYFERARFEISPEGHVHLTRIVAETLGR